jgi:hypothetical protein
MLNVEVLMKSRWFVLSLSFVMIGFCFITSQAQNQLALQNVSDRLDFVHRSEGGEGLAGAAWFDYNNDGLLDLYLTNGKSQKNGLFRNDGNGSFTNVSASAGVDNGLGNSGVIAGDVDNDGNIDLFLTGEGGVMGNGQSPTRLYRNNGDGTFTDITARAGTIGAESAWSAAFADIDRDGFLDLFITSPGRAVVRPHQNKLYRNNGDLTFTDISASAGVDTQRGACATGFCDYNQDGWIDLFIADCADTYARPTPIELFRNNGDLTFTDVTTQAGLDPGGFWMGLTFGDVDNDGDMDVFATNFGTSRRWLGRLWLHALYRNNGDGTYTDIGNQAGVAEWEWGWGCSFADFDNDGYQDLFFAGNWPFPPFDVFHPGLGNPGRLFMNRRDNTFAEIGSEPVFNLREKYTSGVATGDFDNNGFADIVVGIDSVDNNVGRPVLYRNMGNGNHWLTIKTVGTRSNRDGVGARVKVIAGDLVQVKEVRAGSSFLSMDSPWLTFGLGSRERVDRIEIIWPSQTMEQYVNVAADRLVTLIEGEGIVAARR